MRPERDNIAAPDLPAEIPWIGEKPASMPVATAAGPALVHFFDFAQLNSVRTMPYVIEWDRRYREAGLRTIGVQSARFPFGADPDAVALGLERLGIEFPVAIDLRRDLWHSYGCEGWPSLFLWSLGGALSWFHFGEGEYLGTEDAIQAELRELDALRQDLPAAIAPLRATDGPEARVIAPTPELFPSESWERAWVAGADGTELVVPYEAGEVHATFEGEGEVEVEVDGHPLEPVVVAGAGLYSLVEHPRHERHELRLRPAEGISVWSVSFAPGVP